MPSEERENLRGHKRLKLLQDLATGELSDAELAAKYGKTEQTIMGFANSHKYEIAEFFDSIPSEFEGLWLTNKRSRMAEYQQKYEDLESLMEKFQAEFDADTEPQGEAWITVEHYLILAREQLKILVRTADELGQVPLRPPLIVEDRTNPMQSRVEHVIEGVDLDKAFRLTPHWIREHPQQIMDQLVHYVPAELLASLGITIHWISEHPRVALQYLRTYQPPNTVAG